MGDVEFCAWGLFRRLRDLEWDRSARASFVRWPLQGCMLADIVISTFGELNVVHREQAGLLCSQLVARTRLLGLVYSFGPYTYAGGGVRPFSPRVGQAKA